MPDLAGVGLRELRVMDDPELLAAVDEVLRRPGLFAEIWAGEGEKGGFTPLRRHSVPSARREELRGA
ncbi:hypothetical protein [Streptomyces nanshensis]|uniref:Uncharacterized protein n=1 Tax=Streptomyces nanshensis TaxID=518642 RepID=A0A1E7L0W7_9ACTN|nr:hypothetical protein [Streptomyces nanshensis]OEV09824.1 hypothetical protein AN218_20380 [Streptomyces nanshensis]